MRVFIRRPKRQLFTTVISLVNQHEVGEFHDAALDALQLVTRAGLHQQYEHVRHVRNFRFRLANTDGLDKNDVESRRLAKQQGLATTTRNAAKRIARRRGANVCLLATRQCLHACLVTKDRTPADRR